MDTYRSVVESERASGSQRTLYRVLGLGVSLVILVLLILLWLPI